MTSEIQDDGSLIEICDCCGKRMVGWTANVVEIIRTKLERTGKFIELCDDCFNKIRGGQ
jgi:hypothetical protein